MDAVIPNNTNINLVIKSIEDNANAMQNILSTVTNSSKFILKFKLEDLKESTSKLSKISKLIASYLNNVNIIFGELNKTASFNLRDLLGYQLFKEKDKNNNEVIKERYTGLEAINKINEVFANTLAGIGSIGNFDAGYFTIRKTKRKIKAFGDVFKELINSIANSFLDINTSKFKDINNILVGDPEKVMLLIKDKSKSSESDAERNLEKNISTITNTEKGTPGVIDTILKIFSVIEFINNYKLPKLKDIEKKTKSIIHTLDYVFDLISKSVQLFISSTSKDLLKDYLAVLNGQGGLIDIFMSMQQATQQINKIFDSFKTISKKKLKKSYDLFDYALLRIYNIITGDPAKNIIDGGFSQSMNKFKSNLEKFIDVVSELVNTSKQFILLLITGPLILGGIKTTNHIILNIADSNNAFNNKEINNNSEVYDSVSEIIESYNKINKLLFAFIKSSVKISSIPFKIISYGINLIYIISDKLVTAADNINENKLENAQLKLLYVNDTIKSVISLYKNIIILSLLAGPASIASLVVSLAVGPIMILMKSLNLLVKYIDNIVLDEEKIKSVSKSITYFGLIFIKIAGIGLLVISLAEIASYIISFNAILVIAGLLISLNLLIKYIDSIVIDEEKIKSLSKSITQLGWMIIKLVGICMVIAILAEISAKLLTANVFLVIGVLMISLRLLILYIDTITLDGKKVREISIAIAYTGLIFITIAGICVLLVELAILSIQIMTAGVFLAIGVLMLGIAGIILLSWGILKLIDLIAINRKSALSMLYLTAFISGFIVIGLELLILAMIAEKLQFKQLLLFFGVVLGIGVIIFGLGAIIALASPVLAVMTIGLSILILSVSLMLVLALELLVIQRVQVDKKKIEENVTNILDSASCIINAVFGSVLSIGANKSKDGKKYNAFLSFLGGTIKTFASLIVGSMLLTTSIVSIGLMLILAGELKIISLGKFFSKEDKENISHNVKNILSSAKEVINSIFNTVTDTVGGNNGGFFQSMLNFMGGTVKTLATFIVGSLFLTTAIVSVGLMLVLAGELKLLSSQFFSLDVSSITTNVNNIMYTAHTVTNAIFDPKEPKTGKPTTSENKKGFFGFIKDTFKGLANIARLIAGIGSLALTMTAIGMVGFMARELTAINNVKFDATSVAMKTTTIMDSAKAVADKVLSDDWKNIKFKELQKRIQALREMNGFIKEFTEVPDKNAKNSEKAVEGYIKLLDKVNSSRILNLESTANVFKRMAEFSKTINGNFDKLADTLNEKIGPMLEKIEAGINKIPDSVEKGTAGVSSSIFANAPIAARPKDYVSMTEQVNRENPKMTKEEIEKVVDKRMEESSNNESIDSKLGDLITMFRDGDAIVKVNNY